MRTRTSCLIKAKRAQPGTKVGGREGSWLKGAAGRVDPRRKGAAEGQGGSRRGQLVGLILGVAPIREQQLLLPPPSSSSSSSSSSSLLAGARTHRAGPAASARRQLGG